MPLMTSTVAVGLTKFCRAHGHRGGAGQHELHGVLTGGYAAHAEHRHGNGLSHLPHHAQGHGFTAGPE